MTGSDVFLFDQWMQLIFGGDHVQRPASLQDKALVSGWKVRNMVVSLEQARKGAVRRGQENSWGKKVGDSRQVDLMMVQHQAKSGTRILEAKV